jgi:hypothetical protein
MTTTGTVTREQAEAVLQAVKDKFASYCMTFARVDGKLDFGTLVPAPDSELPYLVENYPNYASETPVPFAVVWEGGPFEWALAPLGDTSISEEATIEVQDVAPGAVLRNKGAAEPAGVRTDAVFSYVLGIWEG